MKRHENLYSAILSFVGAALFLAAALIVHFVVIKPLISDDNTAFETLILSLAPSILYIFAAFFLIWGIYALVNDIMIEKGENVMAKVTGVKEYFIGSGTKDVHYNLFCEWKDPKSGRVYKYKKTNLPSDPSEKVSDGKVIVRINKKDPRQYFVDL
ncbi:MAG: hypothetical protein ACI4J5_04830 [Oscillospiraceae bacterium]